MQHETFGGNPFRSTGRQLRSVAACPVSESMDERDSYQTLTVKVEVPTAPMPSCSTVVLKRTHESESETQADSDDEVIEVPSKKQKIESISIDSGKRLNSRTTLFGFNFNEPRQKQFVSRFQCPFNFIWISDVEKDTVTLDEMIFHCVYCIDANELNVSGSGSIEDVYAHWLSCHTDLEDVKPFWFYVAKIVTCFHCDAVSSYHEMVKHHQNSHMEETFTIVREGDRNKCALCPYNGNEMVEHFAAEHDGLQQSQLFNPARLSEGLLSTLLACDIHKKRQCGHCDTIFETQPEVEAHHANTHESQQEDVKQFFDSKSA